MTQPQTLNIQLNPDGVAAPARRAVIIASRAVGTTLRALSNDTLEVPDMTGGFIGYQFGGLEMADEEWLETYSNWILSKGFQDLTRGIRETLEEAVLYIAMIKWKSGLTTLQALQAEITSIKSDAGRMQFPQLLARVNDSLTERMAFELEFASLQKARNCLEHRGGVVSQRDVDPDTNTLVLSFPRFRMFYMRGDEEIEMVPGVAIDTHDPSNGLQSGEEVALFLHRVTRSREYKLNEPVIITASDFFEIAMACKMFADDIASKLPTLASTAPDLSRE